MCTHAFMYRLVKGGEQKIIINLELVGLINASHKSLILQILNNFYFSVVVISGGTSLPDSSGGERSAGREDEGARKREEGRREESNTAAYKDDQSTGRPQGRERSKDMTPYRIIGNSGVRCFYFGDLENSVKIAKLTTCQYRLLHVCLYMASKNSDHQI